MRIFIKPLRAVVRNPITGEILPSKGKLVNKNSYWIRRIKDGDIEIITKVKKKIIIK